MAAPACSDEEFISLVRLHGATETARKLGLNIRSVMLRRAGLEKRDGVPIRKNTDSLHPQRIVLDVPSGVVLVGSDAHIWPGPPSTAMRAFIKFCKELKPSAVILNGDVMDLPRVSRHSPIGWEKQPEVIDELEAAQEILGQIEKASGRARKVWTLGNHDARFETRLASIAPEYRGIKGVHLKDHFPIWEPCWAAWINDDVVVKHRFKGGIHATHNNVLWSGKTMVTGHLHSAQVRPFDDYNGTRYGVDGGCLADTNHAAFTDYTEDNPKNWRSGFAVLTFRDGRLLQPELVLAWDAKHVQFRGDLVKV